MMRFKVVIFHGFFKVKTIPQIPLFLFHPTWNIGNMTKFPVAYLSQYPSDGGKIGYNESGSMEDMYYEKIRYIIIFV